MNQTRKITSSFGGLKVARNKDRRTTTDPVDARPALLSGYLGTVLAGGLFGLIFGGLFGLIFGLYLAAIFGLFTFGPLVLFLKWQTRLHAIGLSTAAGMITGVAALLAVPFVGFGFAATDLAIVLFAFIPGILGALGGALGAATASMST